MNDNEEIEDMPQYQLEFDDLLEKYAGAVAVTEPLENWETQDLLKLIDAADRELQARGAVSEEEIPGEMPWEEYVAQQMEEDDDE